MTCQSSGCNQAAHAKVTWVSPTASWTGVLCEGCVGQFWTTAGPVVGGGKDHDVRFERIEER